MAGLKLQVYGLIGLIFWIGLGEMASASSYSAMRVARLMECSVDVKTPDAQSPVVEHFYVSPFSTTARTFGVYSLSTREQLGQLKLQVGAVVKRGVLSLTGRIAATSQGRDLDAAVPLSFVAGAQDWTAKFVDLQGSDRFGFKNSVRLEGAVNCHEFVRDFAIVSTNENYEPSALVPRGNLESELYSEVLNQVGYCVYGDLQSAYRTLRASREFTETTLQLDGVRGLRYVNFKFVCQDVGIRAGEFFCTQGTEYPNPISIPLCE